MAQSALTVTPPNPTPPTNMSFTGATPPNPPNFTKLTYADWQDNTRFDTSPPPYFDDGTAGSLILFAANTAALASGTGATSGGTENSYPGASGGAVPASTSVAHEGAGTEVSVTSSYTAGAYLPGGATIMVSTGPVLTAASIAAGPNASHASSLSPTTAPTLTTATPTTASGAGNATVTATGTGFTRQSVIWVNDVAYPTTYVSATSLTASAPKKATAGTLPVRVVTGGVITTAAVNWTFT